MASSARRVVVEFLGDDKSASRVARSVDGSTSKLGATFARVGKAAAIGLAAGVVVAGAALVKFGKDAVADEAAQAKLAATLKNTTGATDDQVKSVESWITKQGQALGVTDDELRPALSKLAVATGDVGEAQKLASLAMDASAGTGKSLESVSAALAKAQNGNVSALARLGIETKNAKGETLSFDQVTKNMAATFKGQATKQADTLQGKMARLKLILSEAGETIGAKLIPVVTKMADFFLHRVMPAMARTSKWIRGNVIPALKEMGAWIGKNVVPVLAKLATKAREVFARVAKVVHDHWGDIKATFKNAIGIVRALWARFGDNIISIMRTTWRTLGGVLKAAFTVIRGVFKVFDGILKGDWRQVWDGIKDILRGAWEGIKSILRGALSVVKELMSAAWGVLKDAARGAWSGLIDIIRNGVGNLVDGIKAIPDRLRAMAGSWGSAGRALIGAFVDGLSNAGGIIGGIAGSVWDAVKSMLNSAISRINSALNFSISIPGPNISVNAGQIPYLAGGTRNFAGGLAVVGERGPELVNLPRGSQVTPNSRLGGGSADVANLAVNLSLDGKTVQKVLLKLKRTNGGLALGLA